MTHALSPATVHYRLSLPHPEAHLVDVEVRIGPWPDRGPAVALSMAAWSPGSYLIRDYARYVRQVSATAAGQPCAVDKRDKHTWQVELPDAAGAGDDIVVRYQVYGHDLTVRTNHIDGTHAFLHGPATYLLVDGLRDQPCRVDIELPADRGWHVATGLAPDGAGYLARHADELLDCPIHAGDSRVRSFEVLSAPVELVVWGDIDNGGDAELDRLAADLAVLMKAHTARFGDHVPFSRYTFILMLAPGAYGGLEHHNSSANLHTPFAFASRKDYEGLLELLSHEFFHVWNGKRMAPAALSPPFAYDREAYTRSLWVMEGITSYYDRYTVLRAGAMSARRYLEKLAEEWGRLQDTPGRAVQSLEEASYDAWIKLYKPDECNPNTTVSYYLKGGLVALTLDVLIRGHTQGERSLDDVLRLLWREHTGTGAPYPDDLQPLFERAVGLELGAFFDRFIRGRQDPDLQAALGQAGLELRGAWESGQRVDDRTAVWLGILTEGARLRIKHVLEASPAAAAGLSPGDEIIALDGLRVATDAELRRRLASRAPGDRSGLALFRRGRLLSVDVDLQAAPPSRFEVVAPGDPTAEARAFFSAWLGEDHPGPGVVAAAGGARWI